MKSLFKMTTLSLCMLALAACNNNDDDPIGVPKVVSTPQSTLTVNISLGKVTQGGTVELKNAETDSAIGQVAIQKGKAVFSLPTATKLIEVIVTLKAGDKYFDEATNSEQTITESTVLRAISVFDANLKTLAVTPLTEAATSYAKGLANGTKSQSNILQANQRIADYFNLDNIVDLSLVLSQASDYQTLLKADDANSQYALLLTALVRNAQSKLATLCAGQTDSTACLANPALKFTQALSEDFSDGNLNYKKASVNLIERQKLYSLTRVKWQNELKTALATLPSDLTAKQVTLSANTLSVLNTYKDNLVINGTTAVTPSPLCADLPTLPLDELQTFVKNYEVTIRRDVGARLPLVVKATQFKQQDDGQVILDGVSAQVNAICQHQNVQHQNDGISVYLDKNNTQGQPYSITYFNNGSVKGDDYTSTQVQTFDNSTGELAEVANQVVDVEITGATTERLTSFSLESFLNTDGLLVLDVNGRILVRLDNNKVSQIQFVKEGKIWRMTCDDKNCAGIKIDETTGTLVFNNVTITADTSTGAKDSVTLNGSMVYARPNGLVRIKGANIQTVSVDVKKAEGVLMELAYRNNVAPTELRKQVKVLFNAQTGLLERISYVQINNDESQRLEYACDRTACTGVQFNVAARSVSFNNVTLNLFDQQGVSNPDTAVTVDGSLGAE
ncbi:MAG: hypothetical protein KDI39_03575 [Pseudomonadales bacterium]|nr:hypothetical protein [Pseudomonadales bacterium]